MPAQKSKPSSRHGKKKAAATATPKHPAGFVRFPERLVDEVMPHVSANAWKVLTVIVRDTAGWQRTETTISYKRLSEESGVKGRATISRALAELEKVGAIKRKSGQRDGATNTVRFCEENFYPVQKLNSLIDKGNKYLNGADAEKKIPPATQVVQQPIQWRHGESEHVPNDPDELSAARRNSARRYRRHL